MQTLVDLKSFIKKGEIRNAIQIELTIFSSTDLDIDVEMAPVRGEYGLRVHFLCKLKVCHPK